MPQSMQLFMKTKAILQQLKYATYNMKLKGMLDIFRIK